MPSYKELYAEMVHANEQAICLLLAAQKRCEELYLNSSEPMVDLITNPKRKSVEE